MSKNVIIALLTAFIFTIVAVVGGNYLYETRHQGHFYFSSSGGNTSVQLGSAVLGNSPIINHLASPGTYQLHLTTDNYTTTLPVRLSSQTATVVDWQVGPTLETSSGITYELTPVNTNNSPLEIDTQPRGAIIDLDYTASNNRFSPWHSDQLAPGGHTVTISMPGYASLNIPITLEKDYQLTLHVKLAQKQ